MRSIAGAVLALPLAVGPAHFTEPAQPPGQVAQNCLKPLRPLLPLRPAWCTGNWTQILVCTQLCQCQWQPVCVQ